MVHENRAALAAEPARCDAIPAVLVSRRKLKALKAARSASAKKGWETRREKAARLKAVEHEIEIARRQQEAHDLVAAIQAQKPDWECRYCKAEIGWLGRFLMWLKLPMCSVYSTCGRR